MSDQDSSAPSPKQNLPRVPIQQMDAPLLNALDAKRAIDSEVAHSNGHPAGFHDPAQAALILRWNGYIRDLGVRAVEVARDRTAEAVEVKDVDMAFKELRGEDVREQLAALQRSADVAARWSAVLALAGMLAGIAATAGFTLAVAPDGSLDHRGPWWFVVAVTTAISAGLLVTAFRKLRK